MTQPIITQGAIDKIAAIQNIVHPVEAQLLIQQILPSLIAEMGIEADEADKWQPIETCPENTDVDFWVTGEGRVTDFQKVGDDIIHQDWRNPCSFIIKAVVTHWMHIPHPPKEA